LSGVATSLPSLSTARELRRLRVAGRRRVVGVTLLLTAIALALFTVTLATGSSPVPPLAVLESLLGISGDPGVDFIVRELRLPIAGTALCAGVALGMAGILLQRLLDNPLAAPDLVGVSAGASLAAVAGIVLFGWSAYAIPAGALLGALGGSLLICLIAWRDGISGYRLILVGIGVSELMFALITYLVAHAEIHEAREAMHWLVGSIGQSGPPELRALIVALAVLAPAALILERALGTLELGDDGARALGVRIEPARLGLFGIAVALVGFAIAVAGPLAFVALVAGPIAVRLTGPGRASLLAAALVGASIVLGADLVAQRLLPVTLPTGVVTGAIGAPYLLWILAGTNRGGKGG
jgi:iron complex transport system permease protein